ncbi:MAG: hypothetical protein P8172_04550 [Gammaproteobacteria bacterium]
MSDGDDEGTLTALHFLRHIDLVSLRFEFVNLRQSRDRKRLERIDPQSPAFVVAHLPPQHIAEQTFELGTQGSPPAAPVPSRQSGPSRLAFRLQDGVPSLDLRLESLLGWGSDGPLVQSRVADTRSEAEIAAGGPTAVETAIEAPYRLFLSPDSGSAWFAHTTPRTSDAAQDARTELWHARLVATPAARQPGAGPGVRAVWSPDYGAEAGAIPGDAFDTPLRHHYTDIVNLTHRSDLDSQPIPAQNLALSALGVWLDLEGPARPGPDSVGLRHWTQRTTFGQDTLSVTEERGFLLPTGHPASLVEVSERVFLRPGGERRADENESFGAYLGHRRFIRIATPFIDYGGDWRLPFRSLRLLDLTTPPLSHADTHAPFWVETGDPAVRFLFRGRASDWAGADVDLEFAAMFVPDGTSETDLAAAFRTYGGDPAHLIDMRGQAVTVTATADAAGNLNARVELLDLALAAAGRESDERRAAGTAPFSPVADSMRARLPLLRDFVPDPDNANRFRLADVSAADNPAGIFLARADQDEPAIALDFGHARIGSLALPNMEVAGVSLTHGPFGDGEALSGGALDPHSYFIADGAHQALLLGGLPLTDLIEPGGTDPAKLPSLTLTTATDDEAEGRVLALYWQTAALRENDDGTLAFRPGTDASLRLDAVARSGPDGESGFVTAVELDDYRLSMQVLPGMGIELVFDSTRYRAGPGRPPEYDMGLTDIRMHGLILEVVEFLASASAVSLDKKMEGSGFAFTVKAKSDRLEFAGSWAGEDEENPRYPDKKKDIIAYGPFWFYNVGVSLQAAIFFERKPVEFTFALASPAKPFMITSAAGIWGGAGSFAITLDTRGLVKLAFSIAVGAVRAIEIGGAKGRIMATVGFLITYDARDTGVGYTFIVTFSGGVKISEAIKVSVSFVLELVPVDENEFRGFEGEAKVSIKLKIAFFTFAFSFRFEMFIPGPTRSRAPLARAGTPMAFESVMSREDWSAYRGAFAA